MLSGFEQSRLLSVTARLSMQAVLSVVLEDVGLILVNGAAFYLSIVRKTRARWTGHAATPTPHLSLSLSVSVSLGLCLCIISE